jgi:hypothetical protein
MIGRMGDAGLLLEFAVRVAVQREEALTLIVKPQTAWLLRHQGGFESSIRGVRHAGLHEFDGGAEECAVKVEYAEPLSAIPRGGQHQLFRRLSFVPPRLHLGNRTCHGLGHGRLAAPLLPLLICKLARKDSASQPRSGIVWREGLCGQAQESIKGASEHGAPPAERGDLRRCGGHVLAGRNSSHIGPNAGASVICCLPAIAQRGSRSRPNCVDAS